MNIEYYGITEEDQKAYGDYCNNRSSVVRHAALYEHIVENGDYEDEVEGMPFISFVTGAIGRSPIEENIDLFNNRLDLPYVGLLIAIHITVDIGLSISLSAKIVAAHEYLSIKNEFANDLDGKTGRDTLWNKVDMCMEIAALSGAYVEEVRHALEHYEGYMIMYERKKKEIHTECINNH